MALVNLSLESDSHLTIEDFKFQLKILRGEKEELQLKLSNSLLENSKLKERCLMLETKLSSLTAGPLIDAEETFSPKSYQSSPDTLKVEDPDEVFQIKVEIEDQETVENIAPHSDLEDVQASKDLEKHNTVDQEQILNQTASEDRKLEASKVTTKKMDAQRKMACTECNGAFAVAKKLQLHMAKVHGHSSFTCDECDYATNRPGCLKLHKESRHKGIRYYCDTCPFSGASLSILKTHVKLRHSTDTVGFACSKCPYVAHFKGGLREHVEVYHEGKRYYCDKCEYTCKSKVSLQAHIEAVHENILYHCDVCDSNFRSSSGLRKHNKLRGDATKVYSCDICRLKFCFEVVLRKHKINEHSGLRIRMPCDECDKEFLNQRNLKRHKKIIHRMERMQCDECDKMFRYKTNLDEHKNAKHKP